MQKKVKIHKTEDELIQFSVNYMEKNDQNQRKMMGKRTRKGKRREEKILYSLQNKFQIKNILNIKMNKI